MIYNYKRPPPRLEPPLLPELPLPELRTEPELGLETLGLETLGLGVDLLLLTRGLVVEGLEFTFGLDEGLEFTELFGLDEGLEFTLGLLTEEPERPIFALFLELTPGLEYVLRPRDCTPFMLPLVPAVLPP